MRKREKLFVFDIGNVFVKLNPALRDETVARQDDPASSKRYADVPEGIFRDFRLGRSTEVEYIRAMTDVLGVPAEAVYAAEKAYIAEGFSDFIEVVRRLRQQHRVVCLSNNQAIHWRYIDENLLGPGYFDREYLSQLMGLEKPDPDIFRAVSEAENCAEKDVVFVDDIEENILAAREIGWQHCLLHSDPVETAKALSVLADQPLN